MRRFFHASREAVISVSRTEPAQTEGFVLISSPLRSSDAQLNPHTRFLGRHNGRPEVVIQHESSRRILVTYLTVGRLKAFANDKVLRSASVPCFPVVLVRIGQRL